MTVVAKYMGQRGDVYWVNVRNAKPTGMIGDAGYIVRFDTKEEAKEYVKCVNKTGVDCFQKTEDTTDEKTVRHEGDVFEMTTK